MTHWQASSAPISGSLTLSHNLKSTDGQRSTTASSGSEFKFIHPQATGTTGGSATGSCTIQVRPTRSAATVTQAGRLRRNYFESHCDPGRRSRGEPDYTATASGASVTGTAGPAAGPRLARGPRRRCQSRARWRRRVEWRPRRRALIVYCGERTSATGNAEHYVPVSLAAPHCQHVYFSPCRSASGIRPGATGRLLLLSSTGMALRTTTCQC